MFQGLNMKDLPKLIELAQNPNQLKQQWKLANLLPNVMRAYREAHPLKENELTLSFFIDLDPETGIVYITAATISDSETATEIVRILDRWNAETVLNKIDLGNLFLAFSQSQIQKLQTGKALFNS